MSDSTEARGRRWAAIYRWLLHAYPPAFRRLYGDRMLEDARELVRSEQRPRTRVLLRIFSDLLRSLPREWWHFVATRGATQAAPGNRSSHSREVLVHDTIAALRGLTRNLRYSLGLVLLLTVTIGAATTVAAVVSSYMLRPLPYPEADRLVTIQPVVPVPSREASDLFEIPLTWDLDAFTLAGEPGPELVYGSWVSAGYFEAFGIRAALGRLFTPDETGPAGSSVAVISYDLWQRRWGGDVRIIGQAVSAYTSDRPDDAELFTVVGVLPRGMWHYNRYTEFMAPLRSDNPVYAARLRPDVPPDEVARELLERGRARMGSVPADLRVRLVPLQSGYMEPVRPVLLVGGVAVGLLLVIAWANAGVLVLIRSQRRERELWVRRALGAERGRLARQLGIESLAVAAAAAAIAVLLAGVALGWLGPSVETALGRPVPGGLAALRVDRHAIGTAAVLAVLTAVCFAMLQWIGAPLSATLAGEAGTRASSAGRTKTRFRSILVTGEIALSTALLIAGVLAIRSARHLAVLELGFEPEDVYVASLQLRERSYPEPADRAAFYGRVAEAARALPEVKSAAVSVIAPFWWGYQPQLVEAEGGPASAADALVATRVVIGPDWIETMRVRLLSGRTFGEEDGVASEPVAIVSETVARRLWADRDALGRRIRFTPAPDAAEGDAARWHNVIGVVAEIRGVLETATTPAVYLPIAQAGSRTVTVVARIREGSPDPMRALANAVGAIDASIAPHGATWLSASVSNAGRPSRFLAAFLGSFSIFAVVLALVGLYAVLAFAAAQRRRDVAIRMALGAQRGAVTRHFVAEGMRLAVIGVLLGAGGAVLLARRLSGLLHGVSGTDDATYAATAIVMLIVAVLATWIPSRRAASLDPMDVLREE